MNGRHGTLAAYDRHRRAGEPPCEDCKRAKRDNARDYRVRAPKQAPARLAEGSIAHGTFTAYAFAGCRCDECREYQNRRNARNRADRLQRITTHGIRSSYDAGCRCDACKGARREAYRRLREYEPAKAVTA